MSSSLITVTFAMLSLKQILLICAAFLLTVRPQFSSNAIWFSNEILNRIFGGGKVNVEQFPYQISLRIKIVPNKYRHVLSEQFVLTAAHCTEENGFLFVVVGAPEKTLLVKWDNLYRVKRIISHEHYNRRKIMNDIALLEVKQNIRLNAMVQPIPLSEKYIDGGVNAVISGWNKM